MSISKPLYFLVAALVVVVCCVCMSTSLLAFLVDADKSLMLALTFREHTCLDLFWFHYSRLQCWLPLVLVLLGTIWVRNDGDKRRKIYLMVAIALLVVVLDQVSSGVIKPIVERWRPSHDETINGSLQFVNNYRGGRFGFVSGHATNIVGITTWLWFMFRNRVARLLFIFFAATLCYSRIYLGVHFPGDIICGAMLGFLIARFSVVLLYKYDIMFTTDKAPWAVLGTYLLTVAVLLIVAFLGY